MDMPVDRLRVYVHSRDALAESGLHAQLGSHETFLLEPCPSVADVAVLAWSELCENLLTKIEQLKDSGCGRILLVLSRVDSSELPTILASGACGVLRSTEASAERLIEAIEAAAGGGASLPPDLLGYLLRDTPPQGGGTMTMTKTRPTVLAEREEAVLKLLADGYDTTQIAEALHYSERTIKGVVHTVIRRFGLRNRSHAVAYALRHGLI